MKKIIILFAALCVAHTINAQCTLTGLQAAYCQSDSADSLFGSCTAGGAVSITGSGVNSSGVFHPVNADTGWVPIVVQATYVLDTSETFSPISGSGTSVSLGDDQVSSAISIGFDFTFYGNTYSSFYISSNGFITFDASNYSFNYNGCCSGQSLPNSGAPNDLIAFAWEDLNPSLGGSITYFTTGTSPNQICVINFTNIQHYGGGNAVTSQVQLHQGCGRLEIHTTTMPTDGGSHTMGLENSSGNKAIVYPGRNASSWSASNEVVAWEPSCPDTFYTYVSPGPMATVSVIDSNDCFSDSNANASVSVSGLGPFTYLWSNGQTSSTASGLGSGANSVVVTDTAGCSSETSFFVYSPQPIISQMTSSNAICENGSDGTLSATVTGGVSPYSYAWSSGGSTSSETGLSPGTYSLTVIDANSCVEVFEESVGFDNPAPVVDLGADQIICPGQTKALIAPPGYSSYLWSDGSTTNSLFIFAAGTYSVTVTSATGCQGADEVTVVEVTPDQVDLGSNITDFAPVVIDAGAQYTNYQWSTGANSQTISVVFAGEYSVTVVDTNTCPSNDTIKVKIIPVGVDEVTESALVVFPNPAKDLIQLSYGGNEDDVLITLYDSHGRIVYQASHDFKSGEVEVLDLSALARGHYQLKFQGQSLKTERVIILN